MPNSMDTKFSLESKDFKDNHCITVARSNPYKLTNDYHTNLRYKLSMKNTPSSIDSNMLSKEIRNSQIINTYKCKPIAITNPAWSLLY